MPHEQLDNLVRVGSLKIEPTSGQEVDGLIRSGLARLHDAKDESLNIESRFDLAYNAAHALSLAALRKAGYSSNPQKNTTSLVNAMVKRLHFVIRPIQIQSIIIGSFAFA